MKKSKKVKLSAQLNNFNKQFQKPYACNTCQILSAASDP
jgi:hypothetical protein